MINSDALNLLKAYIDLGEVQKAKSILDQMSTLNLWAIEKKIEALQYIAQKSKKSEAIVYLKISEQLLSKLVLEPTYDTYKKTSYLLSMANIYHSLDEKDKTKEILKQIADGNRPK